MFYGECWFNVNLWLKCFDVDCWGEGVCDFLFGPFEMIFLRYFFKLFWNIFFFVWRLENWKKEISMDLEQIFRLKKEDLI